MAYTRKLQAPQAKSTRLATEPGRRKKEKHSMAHSDSPSTPASSEPVLFQHSNSDAPTRPIPIATPARPKRRHRGIAASFVALVIVPISLIIGYLYLIADEQFASRVGFSVRSEEIASPMELLGGLTALSSGTSKDADVLFEYIGSQNIVERINDRIDLASLYSKPEFDPVFAYDDSGTIEDLIEFWARMVKVNYDAGTGLIEIRANAFSAEDAKLIAREIFVASSDRINMLSAIARDDITRYSKEELNNSVELLKSARQAMAKFRNETQIVDPSADIEGQMGLLTSLQAQLSEALIESDLLSDTTRTVDPRLQEVTRRIQVINKRIDEERRKFGLSTSQDGDSGAFSDLLAQYEELAIDLEFAQESYLLARGSYNTALAESRRQSRYLAAYIEPTLAQRAEYPKRAMLSALSALFLLLGWSIMILIYYSLKDRR